MLLAAHAAVFVAPLALLDMICHELLGRAEMAAMAGLGQLGGPAGRTTAA